ncbi:MAG: hypothetical protein JWQ22_3024, partial [Devosia sp.]|nr:hypothetical protein [Devosia sp.]
TGRCMAPLINTEYCLLKLVNVR